MSRISAPRRVPLLTLLALAVAAALLGAPAGRVGPIAHASASKPFCLRDTHIPDEAYAVEQFARTHSFSPPPGRKGGSPFQDNRHALPALLRPYKGYDVHASATCWRSPPAGWATSSTTARGAPNAPCTWWSGAPRSC